MVSLERPRSKFCPEHAVRIQSGPRKVWGELLATELWDHKFGRNKVQYVLQCFVAALAVFIVLLILDAKTNTAVIASLGASAFIAFTMPRAGVSRPRFLIGGYDVGILSGLACHYLSGLDVLANMTDVPRLSAAMFGGLSVGLAIFLMVVTNLEHPPAAGVALGLVLNNCEPKTILVASLGIVLLTLTRRLMRSFLIDLR